jgi:CBS domain-containing protein
MRFEELDHMPSVMVAMTPFPYSIAAKAGIDEARAMMREHQIRHLPVTERGKLIGVLSERDLDSSAGGAATGATLVAAICARDAYVVELTEPLDEVLLEMAQRHAGAAVIVKKRKLAGILTTTDACRLLAELLRARFRDTDGDDAA